MAWSSEDILPQAYDISYLDWLGLVVHLPDFPNEFYIVQELHRIPYEHGFSASDEANMIDNNFEKHCRNWLREIYHDCGGPEIYEYDVSFFEFLVCLCVRTEEQVLHEDDPFHMSRAWVWFWNFLFDMGLTRPGITEPEIDAIVWNVQHRNYSSDGHGGLTGYIPGADTDLQKVSVWGQANQWSRVQRDFSFIIGGKRMISRRSRYWRFP